MKLLRVGPAGAERPCVWADGGRLLDASAVTADYDGAFFAGDGLTRLRDALPDLPIIPRHQRVGAPIARPGKVVCIGLNYRDHAEESGMRPPEEPVVFFKASNTVIGPNDQVLIPRGSVKTDFEVELAVVIGATARYLKGEAQEVIAGYTISNDLSEREFQLERGGQWVKGKSCETFNPLGPWLVTPDEVPDPQSLSLRLDVNGERRQDGNTKNMIFPVMEIIRYVSQFMVLDPGDVINTGTPAGVGLATGRYIKKGDVMELEIAGLGRQRHVAGQA